MAFQWLPKDGEKASIAVANAVSAAEAASGRVSESVSVLSSLVSSSTPCRLEVSYSVLSGLIWNVGVWTTVLWGVGETTWMDTPELEYPPLG
ncbi:hypothetical protein J4Q44_G00179490 [Coregonus suidteri]|uniref:Uncharacterized protein n=1 Tax=Coregonus suidteri TaxID=861788 RepID=A0AAN8LIT5_9TELE